MRQWRVLLLSVGLAAGIMSCSDAPPDETKDLAIYEAEVSAALDAFHQAASDADGEAYFSLLTQDAVFLGTDASERWSRPDFEAFALPIFETGQGWSYSATERHVSFSEGGQLAWFDELLWNEGYGTCRGSGVLVKSKDGWQIAQYNLTFPIPNALAGEFTTKIKAHEAGQ